MKINGFSLPWATVIPSLIFAFWLGGLTYNVTGNTQEIKTHKAKPSHESAAAELAKIQAAVEYNKERIEEIKKSQEKQDDKLDIILKKLNEQ